MEAIVAIKSAGILELKFTRAGNHKPIKAKLECEFTEPQPNHEHQSLDHVRPLSMVCGDVTYYPTFQRFKGPNTLYRNVASCLLCFRTSNPQVGDLDILLWFLTPNESLGWKTPLEVGRHADKEIRGRIIEAAEEDAPLGSVR